VAQENQGSGAGPAPHAVDVLTAETIRAWPEWVAYDADPSGVLFNYLCMRGGPQGVVTIAIMIEALVAKRRLWRAAQHLALLHHRNQRLTEAWYFAHLAVEWSASDPRALVALVQVLEDRRLPYAVLPLLQRLEVAVPTLPQAAQGPVWQAVEEAYVRTWAYLSNPAMARPWWLRVRARGTCEVRTAMQMLFCAWQTPHIDLAYEAATVLAPELDGFGPRVRVRVEGSIRRHLIETLRVRP
jgi:hypothetical protein